MEIGHKVTIPEMTEAISARLVAQWEVWKNQDAASNNAIIADEFDSFWPDGSRHVGKPTAEQMSAQAIAESAIQGSGEDSGAARSVPACL